MNRFVYMMIAVVLTCSISSNNNAQHFVKKIKSFWNGNAIEKIDQKEFPASSISSLSLNNINGSVTIKTGPKKSLFLRTIKRVRKEPILDMLEVITEICGNHLAITTKNNNKKKAGFIDYELIVPASLDIAINITGNGTVFIKDVHGAIDVVSCDDITVINSKKLVSAQSCKKGSISVINPNGPVEAYAQQGNIIGENIVHNFDARSTSGKIDATYKNVPTTSLVHLTTLSGNITLALPSKTNAAICGQTMHGTFMSDHEITIKSYTTPLNKIAWNKFKKEVDGTLGSGDATIALHSTSGNIKIIESNFP